MKTYDLYVDSGPKMKKTLIQVPALAGCVTRGATTQEAIDGAPDAIRAFLRFSARHGERADPKAAFSTRVAQHITNGQWPAMGLSFIEPDVEPVSSREVKLLMKRLAAMHADVRKLTGKLTPAQLAAKPPTGRPIREILRHMCGEGAYLRGVTGASRIQRLAEKGELDALDALDQLWALEMERLATMPDDERTGVIMRGQSRWTVRSALRRMLEHCWEHHVEIAVRLEKAP